jgi:hypothetical protein
MTIDKIVGKLSKMAEQLNVLADEELVKVISAENEIERQQGNKYLANQEAERALRISKNIQTLIN